MRVVSLLPAGTEMVTVLGGAAHLVGVSHECDYPPEVVAGLPRLTTSTIDPERAGREIDAAVRARLAEGRPLLTVDAEAVRRLRPDAIIAQDVCEVCAVDDRAVAPLAAALDARVVTLSATNLEGIYRDIRTVAELLDLAPEADELVAGLRSRLRRLTARRSETPGVVVLEWLDPPFLAGHWVPELVAAVGGRNLGAEPGVKSRRVEWVEVGALPADLCIVALCGMGVDRARRELAAVADRDAVAFFNRVPTWLLDGNAYTSRPGPRVVDGARLIGEALAERAGAEPVRWRPDPVPFTTTGGR